LKATKQKALLLRIPKKYLRGFFLAISSQLSSVEKKRSRLKNAEFRLVPIYIFKTTP
jgi:hypothetical protein